MYLVEKVTRKRFRQVPNMISWSRLVLGLGALVCMVLFPSTTKDQSTSSLVALALALVYVTDWADGYIARRYLVTSNFGAILDTTVDKAVIVLPVIWLASTGLIAESYWLGWAVAGLTFIRELLVSTGKPLAKKYANVELHVQESGRFKMALQCLAVVLTVWSTSRGEVSLVVFGGAVFMGLYSLYDYALLFRKVREVEAA